MDLTDVDRADEDTFNRILWHARGRDDTYPAWAVSCQPKKTNTKKRRRRIRR